MDTAQAQQIEPNQSLSQNSTDTISFRGPAPLPLTQFNHTYDEVKNIQGAAGRPPAHLPSYIDVIEDTDKGLDMDENNGYVAMKQQVTVRLPKGNTYRPNNI